MKPVGIAAALVMMIGLGAIFLLRDVPAPATAPAPTPAAAPAPKPAPVKKETPPPSPAAVASAPRKAVPKKAPPAPVAAATTAAPTLAHLSLDSDVPGASVFIDRQFVGKTPLSLGSLEPGTKRLQVTADGFESVQRSINLVAGGNTISVRIKAVSLNVKVPVVHKHGMGSCEGTLIATIEGFKYETSNKNDAFTLPLMQAEQFSVDYLEKNLRVKQKGGKTWNFTDKNPNADALFVFHRDVEAARKKLADGYTPVR